MDNRIIDYIIKWTRLDESLAHKQIEEYIHEEQERGRCRQAVLIARADYKAVQTDFLREIANDSGGYQSWLAIAFSFIEKCLFEQAAFILSKLEMQAGLNTKSKLALGNCYGSSRNQEKAIETLLDIDPSLLKGLQDFEQYALLLSHCGKISEAIDMLNTLIEKEPEHASLYNNRACIRTKLTGIQNAKLNIKDYKIALTKSPSRLERISGTRNLANEYKKLGNHKATSRHFIRCYELSNDETYLFFNSLTTLQISQLESGWEDYEYRLKNLSLSIFAQNIDSLWSMSEWSKDYEIVCAWEQGLGDTLFALNYIHILDLLEIRFSLYVQPPLLRTAIYLAGRERVKSLTLDKVPGLLKSIDENQKILPMMSLPLLTKTHFQTIKDGHAYNRAYIDENLISFWGSWLHSLNMADYILKIGLVWQGNPQAEQGPLVGRSIPLSKLHNILSIKNCMFVPLQHGTSTQDIYKAGYDHLFPYNIVEKLVKIDMLDRIAIAKCLDLVITIDTSSVHYCGLFSINTALLLHYSHDWRWGWKQDISPVYPTVKLFRQETPGCWDSAVSQVTQYVVNLLQSKTIHHFDT